MVAKDGCEARCCKDRSFARSFVTSFVRQIVRRMVAKDMVAKQGAGKQKLREDADKRDRLSGFLENRQS